MCLLDMTQYAPPYALRVITVTFGTVASANANSSLAPCRMMPPYSCTVPGQEPGHVLERDERDVERVAEAHEPRALHRRVDVERPGQHRRLVGDDADRAAVEPREADDDVLRVVLMHLEEIALVDDQRG